MDLPSILGTLPQWVTASLLGTIVVAYWRRGVALKGLSNAEKADIRDHLAKEVESMRAASSKMEVHFRAMLESSDRRHEECEREREISRRAISGLHHEIDGLKRQIARYSAEKVLEISDQPPSPEIEAAARRVIAVIDKQEGK